MKRKFTLLGVCLTVGFGLFLGFNITDNSPTGSRTNSIEVNSKTIPTPVYDNSVIKYQDDMDGANDTTALKSRGYHIFRANPVGTTAAWFQGNDAVFPAFNGPTTGYTAANYNAVSGANNIDTWLILPKVNTNAGDSLSFVSRAPLASTFPDSIRVMYSAAGDSTPAGSWVELGRFKVNTAGMWEARSYIAPAPGNARFAIRYAVVNGGPSGSNSDFIGIDAVTIHGPAGGGGNPPNASLLLPTPGVNTNYVAIPHQPSMVGFGNNITIEGWMNVGGFTTANTLLNKGGISFDYQLGLNSTGIPFFRAQGVVATGTGITVTAGVWTHIAVTYDGSTARFYKDGILGATVPLAMTFGSSANEMRIGRGNADPGSGNIEEVRLWSVARSGADILADMCKKWPSTFTNTTGLKAVWHLDSTLVDSVSGYNGTSMGSTSYGNPATCLVTSVSQNGNEIPDRFVLGQNYPNPFNPTTKIKFALPKAGLVSLKVYDMLGREVQTLVNQQLNAGEFIVDFDGANLSSGTYFYRLQVGDFVEIKKMVLLK